MGKHPRDCIAICKGAGLMVLELKYGGRHLKVVCREGLLICPSTPSDQRWRHNFASQAKRLATHPHARTSTNKAQ